MLAPVPSQSGGTSPFTCLDPSVLPAPTFLPQARDLAQRPMPLCKRDEPQLQRFKVPAPAPASRRASPCVLENNIHASGRAVPPSVLPEPAAVPASVQRERLPGPTGVGAEQYCPKVA